MKKRFAVKVAIGLTLVLLALGLTELLTEPVPSPLELACRVVELGMVWEEVQATLDGVEGVSSIPDPTLNIQNVLQHCWDGPSGQVTVKLGYNIKVEWVRWAPAPRQSPLARFRVWI